MCSFLWFHYKVSYIYKAILTMSKIWLKLTFDSLTGMKHEFVHTVITEKHLSWYGSDGCCTVRHLSATFFLIWFSYLKIPLILIWAKIYSRSVVKSAYAEYHWLNWFELKAQLVIKSFFMWRWIFIWSCAIQSEHRRITEETGASEAALFFFAQEGESAEDSKLPIILRDENN